MARIRTINILHKVIIIVPLYLAIIGALAIASIEIEDIENIHVIRVILGFLLVYIAATLIRLSIFYLGTMVVHRTTREFTPQPKLDRYRECVPLNYAEGEKKPHLVLLLHGFTTSPMDWNLLTERLRAQGVDYHAPLINGFGRVHRKSLTAGQKEDWYRQIIDLYDLYSVQYEKISVVGHSMGGMLGCILAQHRPIKELIISGPALFPEKRQNFLSKVVKSKFAMNLFSWIIPMIPKPARKDRGGPADTLDSDSTYRYFQYLVAPIGLLFAMLRSQNDIVLEDMRFDRLTLMYGDSDKTVNNARIEEEFRSRNIPFQTFVFPNTAHNVFVDYEYEQISQLTADLLQGRALDQDKNPIGSTTS